MKLKNDHNLLTGIEEDMAETLACLNNLAKGLDKRGHHDLSSRISGVLTMQIGVRDELVRIKEEMANVK